MADGIATGQCYFNFSSEVLSRTSSHVCGRWHWPMFLLRDGLFTHLYNASFIALLSFLSSLPTMLKLSMVTLWPVVLKWSYIEKLPFDVLWTSLQMFLSILQCIPHHNLPCHICIYTWLHSSFRWDLDLLEPLGGSWWYCLL